MLKACSKNEKNNHSPAQRSSTLALNFVRCWFNRKWSCNRKVVSQLYFHWHL